MDDEVKSIIEELCSDLESEIGARILPNMLEYPSVKRHYDRDMDVVLRARAVLSNEKKQEPVGFIDSEGNPHLSVSGIKGGLLYRDPVLTPSQEKV